VTTATIAHEHAHDSTLIDVLADRADALDTSDTSDTAVTETDHPSRFAAIARDHGAVAALVLLHAATSPGVLPAGPAGHVLVPRDIAASCDAYQSPTGPAQRTGCGEQIGTPVGVPDLVWLHIPGAGSRDGAPTPSAWHVGIAWIRLGLAERLLALATQHLRDREVQSTATLNLPLVRANIADAASGMAAARALLDGVASQDTDSSPNGRPDALVLRSVHHSLDESVRHCLRLFGAWGFLTAGPGGEARAFELLGDTYAPASDPSPSASAPDRAAADGPPPPNPLEEP